jgi:PAS domain S-box-containing protein
VSPRTPPAGGARESGDQVALYREQLELQLQAAKESTQALELSRQRYADLFDLAPIGYASLDLNGMIREINLTVAELFGVSRTDLLGRPLRPFVVWADRSRLFEHLLRCRSESGAMGTEVRLQLPGGRQVPVKLTSRRVVGLGGRAQLLTTFVDVSAERQAQQQEREERAQLEATLRQAPDAVFICDAQGRLVLVNPAGELLVGPDAEGQPIHRAFTASGRLIDSEGMPVPSGEWPLSTALRGRTMVDRDFRLIRADGTRLDLRLSAAPVRDPEGRTVAAVATARDFTERKQAERQLLEITQRLGALLRALPVGVSFSDDPTCQNITGNPALFAQFEVGPADNLSASAPDPAAPGRLVRYFRNGLEVSAADLPLQRAVAEGRMIPPTELEIELPSGRRWIAESSGAPVLDTQGYVIGGVAVTLDITGRKRAEAALARHRAWDEAKVAIGRAAVSGEPLDVILKSAIEAVARAAKSPVGMVRLVDPETRDLVLVSGRNVSEAYSQVAGRTKWGENLAGQVAETGSPHVLEDVSTEPSLSVLGQLSDPPIVSLVGVPLKVRGQVLGTMAIGHPQARRFDATDVAELLPCADMIAGAIRAEQLREALGREAEARALLLRELNHRVRNNLAALIGFLHLAADKVEGPAAGTLNAVAERVGCLADLHRIASGGAGEPAELRELVEIAARSVLAPATEALAVHWRVDGAPVRIPAPQVIPLALVLNELFTNCLKHAFRGRSTGCVTVGIHRIGPDVCLEVWDDGIGPGPGPGGLGLNIAEALVVETLHGSFRLVPARDGGALALVRFPFRADSQELEGSA